VADVVDMEIEMVAPEKWWHCEWLARPEDVTRRGLTLPLPHDPVLNPNAARARVRPVCDVTGRKDPGDARFRNSSTTMPLSVAMPACGASPTFGRTPIPLTTRSQSKVVPSSSSTL